MHYFRLGYQNIFLKENFVLERGLVLYYYLIYLHCFTQNLLFCSLSSKFLCVLVCMHRWLFGILDILGCPPLIRFQHSGWFVVVAPDSLSFLFFIFPINFLWWSFLTGKEPSVTFVCDTIKDTNHVNYWFLCSHSLCEKSP